MLLLWPNLKFAALPVPEIIPIGVLGGVANPNHGEEEALGVGNGTIGKSVVDFL